MTATASILPARAPAAFPAGVVVVPGTEPAGVLRQRCRDGHLVRVVDGLYLPADLEPWPLARAAALRTLLRVDWVGGLTTSVWCRGGPGRSSRAVDPDDRVTGDDHEVDVLAPPSVGTRPRSGLRLRLVPVSRDEIEVVHGVPVTTAVRTAADLMLWGSWRDDAALTWLWGRGTDPAAVAEDLTARGPVRGLPRAARVLAAVRAGHPSPLARHPASRGVTACVSPCPCVR